VKALFFTSIFVAVFAANAAVPEKPADILIRLDLRNLVAQNNEGQLSDRDFLPIIDGANRHWSQCGIRFVPRSIGNVNVLPLDIPFEPKNQGDLSKIATALNPNGFKGAIPFTIAGRWQVMDNGYVLLGLGWVFLNSPTEVNRIGAMVDANKLKEKWIGQLAAHELGHALSLSHSGLEDNVMGGGAKLTPEQCAQARGFSQTSLAGFLEKGPVRASIQGPNG
jgi:hypothetical protein